MSVNTVEVIEGQDIVLVSNGEVVGVILNRTRPLTNGATDYSFQARTVYYPHGLTDNRASFSVGAGIELDSTKLDDFLAVHTD